MVAFRCRPIPYDGSVAPYVSRERPPGVGDFMIGAVVGALDAPRIVGLVVIWLARFLLSCRIAGLAFWTVKSRPLNYELVLLAALAINILMGLGEFYID